MKRQNETALHVPLIRTRPCSCSWGRSSLCVTAVRKNTQKSAPAGGIVSTDDVDRFSDPVTDPWTDPLGIGKGSTGAMIADGIDPDGERVIRLTEEYLRSIKLKNRKMFFARYYYERSIDDIAGIMNVPKGTVLSNLKRTREGLRRFLESRGIEV